MVRLGGVGSRWVRVQWTPGEGVEHYYALCRPLQALQAAPGGEPPHYTYNLTLEDRSDRR